MFLVLVSMNERQLDHWTSYSATMSKLTIYCSASPLPTLTAFGLFPGRVTYVLDKNGVCVKVYDELADAASHVDVAKEALAGLKKTSPAPSNPLAGLFSR